MSNPQTDLKNCIELCWQCRTECLKTLYGHCLEAGGEHVAPDHVLLMTDCIEICQLSADSMTRGSSMHTSICAACADICDACAQSCSDIGGDAMERCAEICRECADSCRKMGQRRKAA